MRKAIQFGAGNIGRGFLGQLYSESSFETVYVDVDALLVERLCERGSYPLRLVSSDGGVTNMTVDPVRAVSGRDIELVAREFGSADIAGTSVGIKALPFIAPALAAGIELRARTNAPPINILLCENQWHAASVVRELVYPHLSREAVEYASANVGLVETVIGRMVPAPSAETLAIDALMVVAEPYKHLPVAASQIVGTLPDIVGVEVAARFDSYEARKLFLHNAGHAALAYLAYGRAEFIWQAVNDSAVRNVCEQALGESRKAIVEEYGLDSATVDAFVADLLVRFGNRALGDTITRVAADPLRKLRPTDRLIGAANLCIKHEIKPQALATVIASAIKYDNPGDPSACEMQTIMRSRGLDSFLAEHCLVEAGTYLHTLITEEMSK